MPGRLKVNEVVERSACAYTSVNFEGWHIEEPPVEESFETGLVEWVGRGIDRDIGHVSLVPAGVNKKSWMKCSPCRQTRRVYMRVSNQKGTRMGVLTSVCV